MSEQRPPTTPSEGPATPAPPPSPEAIAEAADLFLGGTPEPSDDTPTIISKTPRPAADLGFFQGILRGRRLAHFDLIEPIGVGGMAAVLRARDTQLDRPVALKILPPEMSADPENVRRFHQEARAAARLDHETVARVFFCGEDQGLHFIAFEFVEGETLRALIERRGRLPVQEAVHYVLQVATGLVHAAERGVVHRDIKPSNIIVSPNGRAKLVDMGLARSLGPQPDDGLTQSGVTLGTFDYISPEQALEPREADVRSDIYSLGCTFYHVLTGQPPVPEGTAARKLHHHQHVLPLDPRQLAPEIPDDVAAVLARMMAKDPAQRYQKPEHLVQHLLQVTQHLAGPGAEGGGILFMDAPLPQPPRTRPLLVAGLAAAIVIVLVLVIGPTPWSPPPPDLVDPSGARGQVGPAGGGEVRGDPPGGIGRRDPTPPASGGGEETPVEITVSSAADLVAQARKAPRDRDLVVTVTGDLDLSGDDRTEEAEAGVVLRGKKVVVQGKGKDGRRPTLWTQYRGGRTWAGLVLDAESVELRGLRVVADVNENAPRMAGVLLRGGREYVVLDCEFLQGNWLPSSGLSSVAVAAGAAGPPRVTFRRCAFLGAPGLQRAGPLGAPALAQLVNVGEGGQDAVTVGGGAAVTADSCAFGPHTTLFRFERGGKGAGSLKLRHCTALAGDEWAAVHLEETAACETEADSCLFARVVPVPDPGMMMAPRRVASLIRQVGPSMEAPAYRGDRNRYLGLDAVRWRAGDDVAALAPDTFAAQLKAQEGSDERVLPSVSWPFKENDPLGLLERQLEPKDFLAAFRLAEKSPDLRPAGQPEQIVGLMDSPWGRLYDSLPRLDAGIAAGVARKEKVVDPKRETGNGSYRSLAAALLDVKSDDVIAIRHTGELPVSPIELAKSGLKVTIKADAGHRPILTIDGEARNRDPALFRVHDGQLTFEGLEFRLQPRADGFDSQSVVTLFEDGVVHFNRCAVTLSGRGGTTPLAVVTLAELGVAPPLPAPREGAGPKVGFEGCFVRGDGDLVWARASRPFELRAEGTLAALTGSLLNVEQTREDAPAAAAGQRVPVTLHRVTAYLGAHLIRLRCADLKALVPVAVDQAKACLFVSAEGKSLVHFDGPKATDDKVRDKLVWRGEQNQYSNYFNYMLDQQPRGEEMPRMDPVTPNKWKEYTRGGGGGDDESKFVRVTFAGPLWPDSPNVAPAAVTRDRFRVEGGSLEAGAAVEQLPSPSGEPR
jgi:hypothetical protein